MKNLFLGSFSAILLICSLGCNKHDRDLFFTSCDVRQYNFALTPAPTPYLFRKTYDPASGAADSIDAYFWSTGLSPLHKSLRLVRKGETIIFINSNQDTALVVWLNERGRPVKAIQWPALIQVSEDSQLPFYEFDYSYDHNQLFSIAESILNFNGVSKSLILVDTCRYDTYGNITSISDGSFTYDTYSYDYSKKAKQQFYLDMEEISIREVSIELLEYLNFFPELTSPPNVRTINVASGGVNHLLDQRFDNMGKLISYDLNDSSTRNTIIWNCPR